MAVIECKNLEKKYGDLLAVNSLSFSVQQGDLVGFVGPNGAGKTSTLKMMVGLSRPSGGSVILSGNRVVPGDNHAASTVGYMPDDPAFSNWMTPLQHLEFIGRFFYSDKDIIRGKAEESLALFGLDHIKKRKIGGFSKGEKQRLALAHALTGNPSILIMDEPTSGLDPMGRRELLDYIKGLKGRMTILFSTHLLNDVDRVCDRVIMIDKGRLIAEDTISALKDRYSRDSFLLELKGDPETLLVRLEASSWCRNASASENIIEFKSDNAEAAEKELPALVAELGLGIKKFEAVKYSLEDVFMRVLGEFESGGVPVR